MHGHCFQNEFALQYEVIVRNYGLFITFFTSSERLLCACVCVFTEAVLSLLRNVTAWLFKSDSCVVIGYRLKEEEDVSQEVRASKTRFFGLSSQEACCQTQGKGYDYILFHISNVFS